ncbi:MAG: tail fiber domain-containing protein [Chitinophagales bacterium]
MKKIHFLLKISAFLFLLVGSIHISAQTRYQAPKPVVLKQNENCDCSKNYLLLSAYCKNICKDILIEATEIVINDNLTIGTGNPHGHEDPWFMRIGRGKVPFFEVRKEGGIGLGTNLLPILEGKIDLGSNKRPFRQMIALKFSELSDRREKENIVGLSYGLKEIMSLKPVSFTWKSHQIKGTQVGLIAQAVQKIIPEIVSNQVNNFNEKGEPVVSEEDRLSVAYSELVPVLIHAIQEQQAIIESQKQTLNQQTNTINDMEASLSQLIDALQTQGIQTQKTKVNSKDAK